MIQLADAGRRPRRLAIGMFDGVHLGHQDVMCGADCVLTFDRHPSAVVSPDRVPRYLTTPARRAAIIAGLGIPEVVVLPFDAAFAARSASSFVDDVLVGALGATHVSVGDNFRFGHRGVGGPEMLRQDPRFATRVVPLLTVGGSVVSSSSIRSLIAAGEVERAASLLGRWHRVDVLGVADDGRVATPAGQALPGPGRYRCRIEDEGQVGGTFELVVRHAEGGELYCQSPTGPGDQRLGEGKTTTLVVMTRVPAEAPAVTH